MPGRSNEVIGVGVDVVERRRVEGVRFLARFAEYFLTASELAALGRNADQVAFVASRFALKEAVIKAFPGSLSPHDFEIVKKGKKPAVRFFDKKREDDYHVFASISHSTDYAAGIAAIVKK